MHTSPTISRLETISNCRSGNSVPKFKLHDSIHLKNDTLTKISVSICQFASAARSAFSSAKPKRIPRKDLCSDGTIYAPISKVYMFQSSQLVVFYPTHRHSSQVVVGWKLGSVPYLLQQISTSANSSTRN